MAEIIISGCYYDKQCEARCLGQSDKELINFTKTAGINSNKKMVNFLINHLILKGR